MSSGRPKRSFYRKHEALISGGLAVLIVLGLWEYFWEKRHPDGSYYISPLFFSGPSAIAKQFKYTWTQGTLKSDLSYSGRNFIVGFLGALVAGVVLGVIIGWYRRVRLLSDPFSNALYANAAHRHDPAGSSCGSGIGCEVESIHRVYVGEIFPILRSIQSAACARPIWICCGAARAFLQRPGLRRSSRPWRFQEPCLLS